MSRMRRQRLLNKLELGIAHVNLAASPSALTIKGRDGGHAIGRGRVAVVERKVIMVAVGRRHDCADRGLAARQGRSANAVLVVDVVCYFLGSGCAACADHAGCDADFAVAEDVAGDDVEDARDEGDDAAGFDYLEETAS